MAANPSHGMASFLIGGIMIGHLTGSFNRHYRKF